jgi:rubrerythrin
MNSILCVGDLLKRADEFERQLEKFYATIRDETKDSGVRLLTYYLARHCSHLKRALDDFSLGEIGPICEERLECAVEYPDARQLRIIETDPAKVRGRELLECAANHDESLIHLYKSVLDRPLSEGAASLFESLIRIEEGDVVMLKKMIAMDYF